MFLSRLKIDAAATVNPYEVHRLLWSVFPGMPDASRPYLFRVMPQRHAAQRDVLMQSTLRPSAPADPRVALVQCQEFSPRFTAGQRLLFDVRANPVKRMASTGDRVPLIRDDERLRWLKRQLDAAAEVESGEVVGSERLYFRKPGKRPGKIEAVTISGLLRVKDPACLLDACGEGIGPAKSFGCGLLLLRKA